MVSLKCFLKRHVLKVNLLMMTTGKGLNVGDRANHYIELLLAPNRLATLQGLKSRKWGLLEEYTL